MNPSQNGSTDNSRLKKLAEDAMEKGDWTQALLHWKQWWSDFPDLASANPDAMHDKAVCHFHCGEKEVALSWLNRAVECQPEYSYRYSSRGWMKQAMGDTQGAIADYKVALELDPEDAITWNNLGLLEEQLGYMKQAKEKYEVSDALLGMLRENQIEPETSSTQHPKPAHPRPAPTFWNELRRALFTKEGRGELMTFVKNGFTLKGK